MKLKKQAFTLVELIVVITIIAILWTIAFISLQWFSSNSRDSVRLSDVSIIKSSLELYNIDSWKYPSTTEWKIITYSWSEAWTQGVFWKATFINVSKLDKVPIDPLTGKKYIYSVTNNKQEFQLATIFETDNYVLNIINETNAWIKSATLWITWNYNWQILKVKKWSTDYILAVPSLITSTWGTLVDIINNWYLAFNWFKNLPFQYDNSWYTKLWEGWWINLVNSWLFVVYSWSINNLTTDISQRAILITNLKSAYTGTDIETNSQVANLVIIDINNTNEVAILWWTLVNNNLWWSIEIISTSSSWWTPTQSYQEQWLCDTEDITVWIYTIAACNLWTTKAWITSLSYWHYFQFGRNISYENGTWTNGTLWNNYDWKLPWWTDSWSANDWWVGESEKTTAIYSNQNTSDQALMKWPCPTWYHIPTNNEWIWINAAWTWGTNWFDLLNALKMPKSGYRIWTSWTITEINSKAQYWSASPTGTDAFFIYIGNQGFNPAYINPSNTKSRSQGHNIRCFKN